VDRAYALERYEEAIEVSQASIPDPYTITLYRRGSVVWTLAPAPVDARKIVKRRDGD